MLTADEILGVTGTGSAAAGGNGSRIPTEAIGTSRDGRSVTGHRFGRGPFRVSLVAGCHADEPVGPRLLERLVRHLAGLPGDHPALADCSWSIVPHANPDGAFANRAWAGRLGDRVDPVAYLQHAVREAPGDDVEFGFPRDGGDAGARPENRALDAWWRAAGGPFHLHASLHGMALAQGPWFLVEPAWADRCEPFRLHCAEAVAALGYRLHDVDRGGDKGFERIAEGFSTRPDSRPMSAYFRARGDAATAALFRPTSMEAIRRLGGDPLTLVSEMPLLIVPRDREGPSTSEDLARWKERLAAWRQRLEAGEDPEAVRADVAESGVTPMPVLDQMRLQWEMILAGLELVRASGM
jgi:hypothetical protein